jgi:serine/threonine-protein kinase
MSVSEDHDIIPIVMDEPIVVDGPLAVNGPRVGDGAEGRTGKSVIAPVHVGATSSLHAPDIIGLEILEAHAVVRQAGLWLVVRVWETKLGPWGMILSQSPEPGARVRPRTRVHAVVAGRPHLTVPDVLGLRLDAAAEVLRRAGLEPFVTTERGSRAAEPGSVVATRPVAGALVTHGSRVGLTVSRALIMRRGNGQP